MLYFKILQICLSLIFTDSAIWAGSVIALPCPYVGVSVCVCVCAIAKQKTSGCPGDFWSLFPILLKCTVSDQPTSGFCGDLCLKNVFLILVCDDTIYQKRGSPFLHNGVPFSKIAKKYGWYWGSKQRKVCGCGCDWWVLGVGTSMALHQHFNGTSTALQKHIFLVQVLFENWYFFE